MPNTNCLDGIRCPKCGSYAPFSIEATTCCTVYDSGAEAGDLEWRDDAYCRCMACNHTGVVADFRMYYVLNETDGVYASPDSMTRADAEAFLAEFRKRFETQGYYASVKGPIPPWELRLKLEAES